MTTPDLIHLWPRAGDPNSGQWVGVTAPETTMAFTVNGPTLTAVRARLQRAEAMLTRTLTDGSGMTTDMACARRDVRAALEMLGGG